MAFLAISDEKEAIYRKNMPIKQSAPSVNGKYHRYELHIMKERYDIIN